MQRSIFLNGTIYPLVEEKESFEALEVENGKIIKLYESEPQHHGYSSKQTINLNGKTMIPSFTDNHFHFMATVGLYELALNVSEYRNGKIFPNNIPDVGEKVKKYSEGRDPIKPILCFNYIVKGVEEDRLPYRQEIDSWLGPDRFVMFISMDGHSSSYSTKALKFMGIESMEHNGILSGEAHEFNMGKISDIVMKHLNLKTLVTGISNLVNDLLNSGITGVHALDGLNEEKNDLSLTILSLVGGVLPIDLHLYPQIKNLPFVEKLAKKMQYPKIGGCNGWEMDGSIGSVTAAFEIPYAVDETNFGKVYFDQDFVNSIVKDLHKKKYQIISHAIGTLAIERILVAYENILSDNSSGKKNPTRHRIEHFEFPNKDQVNRIVENQILVSAQPGYAYYDELFQQSYKKYLKPEIYNRQIPLKTIADAGGIILGSSDSPIQYHNPFVQIAGMVKFPIENQRLSMFQALQTYTKNAAFATFEENSKGTLEVGKFANMIILDKDPFTARPEEIDSIKIERTFIEGVDAVHMKNSILSLVGKLIFQKKKRL